MKLALLLLLATAQVEGPGIPAAAGLGPAPVPEEQPFPLETTTLKTDGARYYVEGRVRIPFNQTITSLRHMTLVARGAGAVIEVSGKLEIKAATGGRSTIQNVTIEIMPDCKDLLVTEANFSGNAAVVTGERGPANCEVYLQNLTLSDAARIELEMSGGQVDLQDSYVYTPVKIVGVNPSEKNRAKLKVLLLNNKPGGVDPVTGSGGGGGAGLAGGLHLENAYDALVRNNDLVGGATLIKDCQKLDFDGNNVRSGKFDLVQPDVKLFKKTKIQNCDFQSRTTRIFAPRNPQKPDKLERIFIHGSWFQGTTEPEEIRQKHVLDSLREEENGMLVSFKKVSPRMRGLGGKLTN